MSQGIAIESLLAGMRNGSGQPLTGGKVYTYAAGTSTPKNLYTDQALTSAAANPVVLDARGCTQVFGKGFYKFVIKDANDALLATYDNLYYGREDPVWCGTSGGLNNNYILSPSPAVSGYVIGMQVVFVADRTNTGDVTVSVSGSSSIPLRDKGDGELASGALRQGNVYHAVYDGGTFLLLSPAFTSFHGLSLCAGATTGSGGAYIATVSPALPALLAGARVLFKANHANSGAATLNVCGLGAAPVVTRTGSALSGAELATNEWNEVICDGTNWVLL